MMKSLLRKLAAATVVVLLVPGMASAVPSGYPTPPRQGLPVGNMPQLTAQTWILYDATNDRVLSERGPDLQRPMASTTKIMTALVALELGDQDSIVTITSRATAVTGSRLGLSVGEQFPLSVLVKGLMVKSGNDAALAIAEHVAGSVSSFVGLMNLRAAEYGMTNTHFVNPHGKDGPDHYSTARDMLTLAVRAMENQTLAGLARSRAVVIPDTPGGWPRGGPANNKLLEEYEGAIGIKTGDTPRADKVLVAAAERNGRRLYAVVMGSTGDRGHFDDVTALFDYGFHGLGVIDSALHNSAYLTTRPGAAIDIGAVEAGVEAFSGFGGTTVAAPTQGSETLAVVREPDRGPSNLVEALAWVFNVFSQG